MKYDTEEEIKKTCLRGYREKSKSEEKELTKKLEGDEYDLEV